MINYLKRVAIVLQDCGIMATFVMKITRHIALYQKTKDYGKIFC